MRSECPLEPKSVGITQEQQDKANSYQGNVYATNIWNAAIEAAALELAGDRLSQQIIRKLKK